MEVPPFVQKLAACCVDGNVDWNAEQLDADMAWFKKNRIQIMENIPSLTKGNKRKVIFCPHILWNYLTILYLL
jgi:hypothetical protein